MKFTKIFLFILLAFFASNVSFLNAEEVIGTVTVVVSHTITFNCNGGTGSTASQIIEEGTSANLNTNGCARTGYNFSSWSSPSGTYQYYNQASYTMGTADVTLSANWIAIAIPLPPTWISGTASSCDSNSLSSISLSWNTSTNATTYQLYRQGKADPIQNNSLTSFTDSPLTPSTTYKYIVHAANGSGESPLPTDYTGLTTKIITTPACNTIPTVTTTTATSITQTTATSGGYVTSDGGATVTARGVVFNEENSGQNPTLDAYDGIIPSGSGTGPFTSNITGLNAGTIYYVRAYATNSIGTSYGSNLTFTTIPPTPTLNNPVDPSDRCTNNWLNLSWTASTGATTYVIYRSTTGAVGSYQELTPHVSAPSPSVLTIAVSDLNLSSGATYYYKIAAANGSGDSPVSNVGIGKVYSACVSPTVTTTTATSITQTTATSGGNVTSDGGQTVTARGVVWSTTSIPTSSNIDDFGINEKTTDGTGTSTFTSNLSLLDPNTLYHYRAYATNSEGTSYGSDLTFTTLQTLPDLTSGPATPATATLNVPKTFYATITNNGGSSTEIGFNYFFQTTVYPDDDPLTSIDIEDKTFSVMNDLSPTETGTATVNNTFTQGAGLYYMRVCADKSSSDNSGLITESNEDNNCGPDANGGWTEITVISAPDASGITTTPATYINQTSAKSGGSITSDGGVSITAKGVVWSTTSIPDSSNIDDFGTSEKTTNGTGTDTFISSLANLTANTTYYYRAYATNSVGTSYGNELTFKTLTPPTGLEVTPSDCDKSWLNLSWDVFPGATGYQISKDDGTVVEASTLLVSEDALGETVPGYTCDATKCRGSDTNVEFKSTHTYQIRASNSLGFSELSSPAVLGVVSNLCPVTGVTVENKSPDSCDTLDISWNPSLTATTYVIYRGTDRVTYPTHFNVSALTDGVPTTTKTETGLTSNTYYYKIAAAKGDAESEGSVSDSDSGVVDCNIPVEGTLSSGGCFISKDKDSCYAKLDWEVIHPIGNSRVEESDGVNTDDLVSSTSATSGKEITFFITKKLGKVLTLFNKGIKVASITPPAICNPDLFLEWNGSSCAIKSPDDETTTFTANPPKVFNGENSILKWESPLSDTCTGDAGFSTGTGNPNSGSVSVGPLTKTTTYTLICTNETASATRTATVEVSNMRIKEN